jgi:hypothetical protein
VHRIVETWRRGSSRELAEIFLEGDNSDPAMALLNEKIIYDRNRQWMSQVEEFLEGEDDFLIIVGALHLGGEGSLPDLLERAGYSVEQL